MSRRDTALEALLLLSGFCGISYEILYARLLGNLFGSQFVINASILFTFLLGIGLGSLWAHRVGGYLWLIEAAIGLYAAILAALYPQLERLVYAWIPAIGVSPERCGLAVVVLLLPPALLIGCSVPLFAAYLDAARPEGAFARTYELYNLGAALTAIGIEFVVLRALGIRGSTWLLASLNGVVAVGVLTLVLRCRLEPRRPGSWQRFAPRLLWALAMASVGSAVFQALMIKLAEFLFGPFNETFALVLAVVLVGLALGSVAVARLRLSFGAALLLALAGLVVLVVTLPAVMWLYARVYATASSSYPLLVTIRLGAVFGLMGPAAVGFGATIPALLREHLDVARESGQLLFVSSLANAAGFFLMAFVLHRHLEYGQILIAAGLLTGAALVTAWRSLRSRLAGATLAAILVMAVLRGWREELLFIGHTSFHSVEELEEERRGRRWAEWFKGPQDVFAFTWKEDEPYLFLNGYISIPLRSNAEKLVGAISSMLAPRHDRALVLGLGSGATAGTVALLFDSTEVVEINRVLLDNVDRLSEYSFSIQEQPGVRLLHDDAIHHVRAGDASYSLILNTVTTPLYFSSSKLYTRDFLAAVVSRLTADGVYVTWVDERVGDRGFEIILESLATAFEDCWLSYMNSNYFLLACSQAPLRPHQVGRVLAEERLARALAAELELPLSLVPYHVLSVDALRLRSGSRAPVNTLDAPQLEFEMARLRPGGFRQVWKRLQGVLDLPSVERAFVGSIAWSAARFALTRDLRTGRSSRLNRLLEEQVRLDFGEIGAGYAAAALAAANEVGSASAFSRVGKRLLGRDQPAVALAAFSEAARRGPEIPDLDLYLGRSQQALAQFEAALAAHQRQLARDGDARAALGAAEALLGLGRPADALAILPAAAEPRAPAAEVAYLRGLALRALGDASRANLAFREALRAEPSHLRAQAALAGS